MSFWMIRQPGQSFLHGDLNVRVRDEGFCVSRWPIGHDGVLGDDYDDGYDDDGDDDDEAGCHFSVRPVSRGISG